MFIIGLPEGMERKVTPKLPQPRQRPLKSSHAIEQLKNQAKRTPKERTLQLATKTRSQMAGARVLILKHVLQ